MCAGKTATSNNAYGGAWGRTTNPLTSEENTNTGEGNAFISGSPATGNWWKVDLGAPGADIAQIKYRPRNDAVEQGQGLLITMLDKVCTMCCRCALLFALLPLTRPRRTASNWKAPATHSPLLLLKFSGLSTDP